MTARQPSAQEPAPPGTAPDRRMVTFPDLTGRARPVPEPGSAAFWNGLAAGRLVLAACPSCSFRTHLPTAGCPSCPSAVLEQAEVAARGVLYSCTVCYREFGPGLTPPYIVGLVDLDEAPGCRLVTNVVNAVIADVRPGMPVRGVFASAPPYLFFEPA
jgi:uncharacterized protein